MSKSPPPLPTQVLRRVSRLATLNGTAVLLISGLLAVASLAAKDFSGAFAGLVIAAAGAMELRGLSLVKTGSLRGNVFLVGSQVYLLAVILTYVAWKLSPSETEGMERTLRQLFRRPEFEMLISEAGVSERELSEQVADLYRPALIAVALLTGLHQGAMAWFYHSRRHLALKAARDRDVSA